ncbi:MAG: ATP-binding cassette domain-containing protein [Bacilli bacterium]|nr:ATP-binding cassette domain-containing protein [Bacilli bacterium]
MIELKNVTKIFDDGTIAIKDINLKINDGDIYGIIGLSGAGKSTLVRCINNLEKPTSGEVLIDGVDISKLNKKDLNRMRKKIGMVFQNFALLEQRTVFGNVRFAFEINHTKLPKEEIDQKVNDLLKLVGLEDKAKTYPSTLSGGQKQRVAIARALANTPKYLLCDEATSALDPNTTDSILSLLHDINKKLGITIVVISHDMYVIYSVCKKIAVLDNSQVVEEGDVDKVFADPKSEIAKRLLRFKKLEEK